MNETVKLLTARQLAEHLGMSLGSVYKLAQDGSIPSYCAGRKRHGVRFDLDEVRQALRRQPVTHP